MTYKVLKKARVIIALLLFILTATLFLDIYEKYSKDAVNQILYLQFVPSLLNFSKAIAWSSVGFIVILILSFLFGRIYCSTICPLGIMQDMFSHIAKKTSKRKFFYKKKKGYPILRYSLLALCVIALFFGFNLVITLLDPYSNFGRIITYLIKPIVVAGNNIGAMILHQFEIYGLNPVKLVFAPWFLLLFTLALFLAVAYMSFKRGRLFCNTICPVGTLLGLISKVSIFKIQFDESKCTKCGQCVGICKSECIDVKNLKVDHSRCVDCFNCLEVCPEAALDYTFKKTVHAASSNDEVFQSRRTAIVAGLTMLIGQKVIAESTKRDDKLELKINKRDYPVAPPGAISIKRFNEICTGCGLCVAVCPTQVLQPAVGQYGLKGFMQPHMDYLSGFCNFDCKECSQVCPTGAILPISLEEKHLTQLGKAIFVKENCVVYTDGTDCGACSEHCPTKAVDMVPYEGKLRIPEVNQKICIGCGACEHPCPVEAPYKAIYVNGNAVHQAAEKPKEEENLIAPVEEDFPF